MNKTERTTSMVKFIVCIVIVILIWVFFPSCDYSIIDEKETADLIQISLEKAYFEGQRDALNGEIKIKLNSDSVYYWIESPWNSGCSPLYKPTYLDTKYGCTGQNK